MVIIVNEVVSSALLLCKCKQWWHFLCDLADLQVYLHIIDCLATSMTKLVIMPESPPVPCNSEILPGPSILV